MSSWGLFMVLFIKVTGYQLNFPWATSLLCVVLICDLFRMWSCLHWCSFGLQDSRVQFYSSCLCILGPCWLLLCYRTSVHVRLEIMFKSVIQKQRKLQTFHGRVEWCRLCCLCWQVVGEYGMAHFSDKGKSKGKDYCIFFNPQWARLPQDLNKAVSREASPPHGTVTDKLQRVLILNVGDQ